MLTIEDIKTLQNRFRVGDHVNVADVLFDDILAAARKWFEYYADAMTPGHPQQNCIEAILRNQKATLEAEVQDLHAQLDFCQATANQYLEEMATLRELVRNVRDWVCTFHAWGDSNPHLDCPLCRFRERAEAAIGGEK